MESLLKTPLYNIYGKYGAQVIDFSGWALPVQFSGIIEEHKTVREKVGLFDVSHMGEILVFGEGSEKFLDYLFANDISSLKIERVKYAHMCYPNGGVVDDILVYRYGMDEFLLVVNASNIEKDFEWIKNHAPHGIAVENVSEVTAQIAIQGPFAKEVLKKISDFDLEMKYYSFKRDVLIFGYKCIISRTGYTGEDGFEINCAPGDAINIWEEIMKTGEEFGIKPIGLGARDTLRFEACMPLYGHELSESVSPIQAGLERYVKTDKDDFIGKDVLKEQIESGVKKRIFGLEMIGRGIPRNGYQVLYDGTVIGTVTTGSYCPTNGKNNALALIEIELLEEKFGKFDADKNDYIDKEFQIKIRDNEIDSRVVKTPFYRRQRV